MNETAGNGKEKQLEKVMTASSFKKEIPVPYNGSILMALRNFKTGAEQMVFQWKGTCAVKNF